MVEAPRLARRNPHARVSSSRCALLWSGCRLVPERRHLPSAAERIDRVAPVLVSVVWHPHPREGQHPRGLLAAAAGPLPDCQAPISARTRWSSWPAPRLFAGTAARFGYRWDLPAFLVLFAGPPCLSCIDLEHMILPEEDRVSADAPRGRPLLLLAQQRPASGMLTSSASSAPPDGSLCSSPESGQPTAPRVRRRQAGGGPGPRAGLARVSATSCWGSLPPTSSEPWSGSSLIATKTMDTTESDSLWSLPGRWVCGGGVRWPRAPAALHALLALSAW